MRPLALLTTVAALAAATAHAQPYPQGDDARSGPPQGYGQGGPYGAPDQGGPSSRQGEGQAGGYGQGGPDQGGPQRPPDLRTVLRLRPDQEAAYRAYRAQTAPNVQQQARDRDEAQRLAGMSTPDRLDMIVRQMQREQADFAVRSNAVRRFYAQLTPAQQRAFDRATAPPPEQDDGQGRPGDSGGPSQGGGYPQTGPGGAPGGYPQPR